MANIGGENKVVVMTVNLKKLVRGCSKIRWAPCAVRNLKREIRKQFRTKQDVKIDVDLNKAIWVRGKKHLPNKVRVEVGQRPSQKEAGKMEYFLKHVVVPSFAGLQCESIALQE